MDQRSTIKKHSGVMMILVIVFIVSAPPSAGGQLSVTDVEKGDYEKMNA